MSMCQLEMLTLAARGKSKDNQGIIASNSSPNMESNIKAMRKYAIPVATDPPVCATRLPILANDTWKSGITRMARPQIDCMETMHN